MKPTDWEKTTSMENRKVKEEPPLTQSISQTKGVQNLNKFLQNLLSDSDDESDGESFLDKYRKGKREQATKKQEEKQPEAKPLIPDSQTETLDAIVEEEEKRDVIADDLQDINNNRNLEHENLTRRARSEQDQHIQPRRESPPTGSDRIVPSVNF